MKKVKEETAFISRKAKEIFPEIDFVDTFSTTNQTHSLEDICQLIFNSEPPWVTILFKIRNLLARFVGLKMEQPADYHTDFVVGGYIKFFKIYTIAENEVILGADDSHLNFRAVISRAQGTMDNIKVTTLVKFNNKTGKIYMKLIKPFHKAVLIGLVKKAYSLQ